LWFITISLKERNMKLKIRRYEKLAAPLATWWIIF